MRARTNLRVEIRALATRILFEGRRAVGVEYLQRGQPVQARATREVLLAGGAYNSPQLLMLSGIGRPDELRAAGIEPFHALPGVGQNLQEHASVGGAFVPRDPIPLIEQMRFDRMALSVIQWQLLRTGVIAHLPLASIAFYRSRPEVVRPDIEFMVNSTGMDARVWFPLLVPSRGNAMYCGNIVLHPESRGWVRLRSADPGASVRIQLNVLKEPGDRALLRLALRNMREFFATEPVAGLIAHEDLRAAEFLATRPEVDPARIASMGLSMGSFRSWQVAALSDRIAAGVAICWMSTVRSLMSPGNNQTRGQSAFSMTHPGLFRYLDYPDVASLACPKPMLFFNGTRDALFPVEGVEAAYAKLRPVWESQQAGDRIVTRLWDAPHVFDQAMQEEAFAWLDRVLRQ